MLIDVVVRFSSIAAKFSLFEMFQTKIPVKWMAIESLTENKYTTKSDV